MHASETVGAVEAVAPRAPTQPADFACLLRTRVERGACWFDVCTYVPPAQGHHDDDDGPPPWTAVWRRPGIALAWLRYYPGLTSPGGLEEAHAATVARVRAGTLPQEGTR